MMCGSTFRHNVVSFQNDEFLNFGKLTAKGLLQGSAGPNFFGITITDYILFGDVKCLNPPVEEVPPGELKDTLVKLQGTEDAEEFKSLASFGCDFRFSHGYTKPVVTLQEKDEFLKAISLHAIVLASLHELDQFIQGLTTCGILEMIRANPELFRPIFQLSKKKLTADLLDNIFLPLFSPGGSNKRVKEESVVFNFNQMLENVEKGKVVEEVNGAEVTISLSDILMFATGACEVPAIGFSPRPTLQFNHDTAVERKLSVSTCANILTIPISDRMCALESFEKEFIFCILNSPGFGNI